MKRACGSCGRGYFGFIAVSLLAIFPVMTSSNPIWADDTPRTIKLIAFGDSLTAGYMLKSNQSFAAQLEMALQAKGHKVKVVNAGVSGDTSAAGLTRLDWTLSEGCDAVILELGANDALRGIDPNETRSNLDKILAGIKAKGADTLIAGMKAPGNWGDDYAKRFNGIFPALADKFGAQLYPFFLEGVALDPALVLSDGLHPTSAGVAEIVRRILPQAEALVARAATRLAAVKN